MVKAIPLLKSETTYIRDLIEADVLHKISILCQELIKDKNLVDDVSLEIKCADLDLALEALTKLIDATKSNPNE